MPNIFYVEMFRAMAAHITESHDFQLWVMEHNVSWERDCHLDWGFASDKGERLEDWEMVKMYLTAIGDLRLEGFTAKRKGVK